LLEYNPTRGIVDNYVSFLFRNKKVIFCLNWDKEDMPSAASREVPMTKAVIDPLTALGKLQC